MRALMASTECSSRMALSLISSRHSSTSVSDCMTSTRVTASKLSASKRFFSQAHFSSSAESLTCVFMTSPRHKRSNDADGKERAEDADSKALDDAAPIAFGVHLDVVPAVCFDALARNRLSPPIGIENPNPVLCINYKRAHLSLSISTAL